jgi:hypothetical protein
MRSLVQIFLDVLQLLLAMGLYLAFGLHHTVLMLLMVWQIQQVPLLAYILISVLSRLVTALVLAVTSLT